MPIIQAYFCKTISEAINVPFKLSHSCSTYGSKIVIIGKCLVYSGKMVEVATMLH